MATKTDIELKIVDSVDTSHTEAEVLTDSAANPDAFYVSRGYLAHNGEKVIEGIDPNGSYPNMTVGNAQKAKKAEKATHADTATDLSGRVEATPEVFTYRPSAGEKSIKDDNAFIRRVKGNSVVWNQLSQVFPHDNTRSAHGVSAKTVSGTHYIECSGTTTAIEGDTNIYVDSDITPKINGVSGHKYLFLVEGCENLQIILYKFVSPSKQITNGGTIVTCTKNELIRYTVSIPTSTPVGTAINEKISVLYIDLTQMFGAGNEPTTVEEFRALYPNSYYPYNAGELRNLDCYGIKTVGFNQWDGNATVGYIDDKTGTVTANQDSLCTDFIRVIPNQKYYINTEQTRGRWGAWYDANKNYIAGIVGYDQVLTAPANAAYVRLTIKRDDSGNPDTFCINLHHTGWRDGDYEPYKEITHALPLSQITNGEPLRKAGSVYDEINETHYIKRVGVRPYTEGDKNDATLLTDGTNTNYPLAEPIVIPITTPIDFNYYVEDFGTEEALLAEDSAPFSADIVYQFNATDQIRNNTRNIDKLQKSAFTPRGTSAQYIRGDGSYGNRVELSQSTPINDGEYEMPDEGDYDMQFILTPSYYAKSPRELDDTTTIAVFVAAPEDSNYLAEYWFEFAVGETLPNIEYYQPNNSDAVFRIDGDMMTYAVNILHLISSDGGETFFGEIKNYVL